MKRRTTVLSTVLLASMLSFSLLAQQQPASLSATVNNGLVTFSWAGATGLPRTGPVGGFNPPGRGILQYKANGGSNWQGIASTLTAAGVGSSTGTATIPVVRIASNESLDSVHLRVVYSDRNGLQSISNELFVENSGFNGVQLTTITLNNGTINYAWATVYLGRGWLEYKPKGGTFWRGIGSTRTTAASGSGSASISNVPVYQGESLDSVSFRVAYYRNGQLVRVSQEAYVANVGFTNKRGESLALDAMSNIRIFPNPVVDFVNIENVMGSTISVMDMNGRVLLQEEIDSNDKRLSLSTLSNGVYILRVKNGANVSDHRLIKQ